MSSRTTRRSIRCRLRVTLVSALSAAVIPSLLTALPLAAQARDQQRASLRDVASVGILVSVDEDLVEYISESRIQTLAELALRRSNVIISEGEAGRDGILVISLLSLPDEGNSGVNGFSVSTSVEFFQAVQVLNNEQYTVSPTWWRRGVAYWGINRVRDAAERIIGEDIDEFLNDLLAAR